MIIWSLVKSGTKAFPESGRCTEPPYFMRFLSIEPRVQIPPSPLWWKARNRWYINGFELFNFLSKRHKFEARLRPDDFWRAQNGIIASEIAVSRSNLNLLPSFLKPVFISSFRCLFPSWHCSKSCRAKPDLNSLLCVLFTPVN